VIPKTSSGVFNSTSIEYVLRNLGVRYLIIAGTSPTSASTWRFATRPTAASSSRASPMRVRRTRRSATTAR
jgi:nicotinamidase-related amidase